MTVHYRVQYVAVRLIALLWISSESLCSAPGNVLTPVTILDAQEPLVIRALLLVIDVCTPALDRTSAKAVAKSKQFW